MKFVICTPRNLRGGTIVLHELCRQLANNGYDSRIFYADYMNYKHPFLFWPVWLILTIIDFLQSILSHLNIQIKLPRGRTKNLDIYSSRSLKGCKRKYLPFVDNDTIVVYPDVAYGNFLHAKKVVRYFLYYNRFNDSAYGKNDLFISYSKTFLDEKLNPEHRIARIEFYDLDLYKQTNFGQRNGKCFLIWKGIKRKDIPTTFDGIVIDKLSEEEKVAVLNKCKYLYSYDEVTSYNYMACMCGCIPIIVPEEGRTLASYREPGRERYGVAIGDSKEQIDYAIKTRAKTVAFYNSTPTRVAAEGKKFIKYCDEYFTRK